MRTPMRGYAHACMGLSGSTVVYSYPLYSTDVCVHACMERMISKYRSSTIGRARTKYIRKSQSRMIACNDDWPSSRHVSYRYWVFRLMRASITW